MKTLGIDFTSAPNGSNLAVAFGELADGVLHIESVRTLTDFKQFEELLDRPGPWIAGIDFPFGQPARLIRALHWPTSWAEYVSKVGSMQKEEFESAIKGYCETQPYGAKQHRRITDERAGALSPMKLDFVPVGKMFFQGAPRILRSGASVIPCAPNESKRVIVETYPARAVETLVGTRHYKENNRNKRNEAKQLELRRRRTEIVSSLLGEACRELYGHSVVLPQTECERLIEEASADRLDAVLCAVQAAWAFSQPNYGVPELHVADEGWIVDPSQRTQEIAPQPYYDSPLDRVTIDPAVCHGQPCIRGLRYPVDTILDLLSSGMTTQEILADYNDLEPEDVSAALAFGAHISRIKRMQAMAS